MRKMKSLICLGRKLSGEISWGRGYKEGMVNCQKIQKLTTGRLKKVDSFEVDEVFKAPAKRLAPVEIEITFLKPG